MLRSEELARKRMEASYPESLRALEMKAIHARRKKAAPVAKIPKRPDLDLLHKSDATEETTGFWIRRGIGLAVSGGGIRSAIFGLGVLQAMMGSRFVRLIDFLSTVSGGSYIGSYLGRHYLREAEFTTHTDGEKPNHRARPPHPPIADIVEDVVGDSHSSSVYWLRENGRYLAPAGGGDVLVAGTAGLRDWLSLQAFLLVFVVALLCVAHTAQTLCQSPCLSLCDARMDVYPLFDFSAHCVLSDAPCSPFAQRACHMASQNPLLKSRAVQIISLPILLLVALCLVLFVLYWLAVSAAYFWYMCCDGPKAEASKAKLRRDITEFTSYFLLFIAVVAAYRFIDVLGRQLFFSGGKTLAAGYASMVAASGIAARLWTASRFLRSSEATSTGKWGPMLATGVAFVLLLAYLAGLSALSYWCVAVKDCSNHAVIGVRSAVVWTLALLLLSGLWGRFTAFLNLASLHALYTARLVRAFLGASNPARWRADGQSVTEPIPGDDVELRKYRPYEEGGPFHIINTTLNETLSGESQLERRDRKGLPVAISPLAMSVGVSHHAKQDTVDGGSRVRLTSLRTPDPDTFVVFPSDPVKAEGLSLGDWVGMSGAAVSTGMGSYTSIGFSMLLGFFNLRLGYWWDSGIRPGRREKRTPLSPSGKLAYAIDSVFAFLFPAQIYLLDEFFGRFRGPARRYWNLTDGGHFENTGVYELIRRQLPLIICLDNGADPGYTFASLGTLVRLARTDFGADIRFLDIEDNQLKEWNTYGEGDWSPPTAIWTVLEKLVAGGDGFFGSVKSLKRTDDAATSGCHAAIAVVRYIPVPHESRIGILIWVKPALTGDEEQDVVEYHTAHSVFPQESTADQFFDEAQWESYRKLGRHTGEELVTVLRDYIAPLLGQPKPRSRKPAAAPRGRTRRTAK